MREARDRIIALLEVTSLEDDRVIDGSLSSSGETDGGNKASASAALARRKRSQAKSTASAIDEEVSQAEALRQQLREEASVVSQRIAQLRQESLVLVNASCNATTDEMAHLVRTNGQSGGGTLHV